MSMLTGGKPADDRLNRDTTAPLTRWNCGARCDKPGGCTGGASMLGTARVSRGRGGPESALALGSAVNQFIATVPPPRADRGPLSFGFRHNRTSPFLPTLFTGVLLPGRSAAS